MTARATYLLPIWIDLTHEKHEVIMCALNDALTEFFEEQSELIANVGCTVNVQWSINKHVDLKGERK